MKIHSGSRSSLTHVARRGRSQQRWRRKLRSISDWDGARNGFGRQQTFCYRVNLYVLCAHKAQIGYGLLGIEHITSVVLINRWLVWTNKLWYKSYKETLASTKTEWAAGTWNIMGESQRHYANQKKPDRQMCTVCFQWYDFWKMQNHRDRKHQWLPSEGGGRWLDAKGYEGTFGGSWECSPD